MLDNITTNENFTTNTTNTTEAMTTEYLEWIEFQFVHILSGFTIEILEGNITMSDVILKGELHTGLLREINQVSFIIVNHYFFS